MQLDAIESGLARAPGAPGEGRDRAVDLRLAHRAGAEIRASIPGGWWNSGRGGPDCGRPASPSAARVAELHDEPGVEAVDRLAELGPKRNEIVPVHGRVASDDPPFHQHRHIGGNDRADPAGGELRFPIDPGLGQRAVLVVEAAGNVRAEDPVLHR